MTINNNEEFTRFVRAAFDNLATLLVRAFFIPEKDHEGIERKKAYLIFSERINRQLCSDLEKYVRDVDSSVDSVSIVIAGTVLTESVVLKELKSAQPITTTLLDSVLREKGFEFEIRKLKNILDYLRKHEFVHYIHRDPEGDFVLTERGLKTVPHGNFRSSSDIERALVLGRRTW